MFLHRSAAKEQRACRVPSEGGTLSSQRPQGRGWYAFCLQQGQAIWRTVASTDTAETLCNWERRTHHVCHTSCAVCRRMEFRREYDAERSGRECSRRAAV